MYHACIVDKGGGLSRTLLVTGAAGFIGSHTVRTLVAQGDRVVGLDNLNDYYDPARKRANLDEVRQALTRNGSNEAFTFRHGDIRNRQTMEELFSSHEFDGIVHLAAMAGVRVSIESPHLYCDVNINGTLNLLDAAVGRLGRRGRRDTLPTFVFASTSSVYGNTEALPFRESDPCDRPLAPYAASKKAGELLGYSYHHVYGLPFTALRFFTVYGPRGRPDMMAYKVLDNIFFGQDVPLYNSGNMYRDWTFVSDIVHGVVSAVDRPFGYEILNLGRGEPVSLAEFVQVIEECVGQKANVVSAPMPEADVVSTCADISRARELLGYAPQIPVREGISLFWAWYQKNVLGR
ncbi:MAG: SDR family NAD(P)-dependent oxidoreductase [Nitrospira sp. SB0667_bin_9]|nr:SDR family NAD(P)-dependent oxidoreductase [Nitrospira sp. SB0667_bin_9]MYD31039.1 SDR family NAD(P)-dependent oxidoreductase [Nitrospira sp. SB0661_bin_20]MYJ22009.1 SDR family NAD(P)-dependent oxidoreductase [Nitrospira sp. SB0673_bin_12]